MSAMNRKLVRVLGVLVLLSVYWTSAEGAITCTVPSVSAGGSTNVTCVFPQDIRISKNNIKVQRQPLDTKEIDLDKTENVLECHWLDQQTLNCDAKPGYKLIGQVSNRAVVGIPTATNAHEGKYTCEVVPSEPSDIHPCYFYLKEKLDAAFVYERLSQLSEELLEVRHEAEKDSQEQTAVLSAVLVFAVLCFFVIVAVALYVFQKPVRAVLLRRKPSRDKCVKPEPGKVITSDHIAETNLEKEDENVEELKPFLPTKNKKDQNKDGKSLPESKSAPGSSANAGAPVKITDHQSPVDNAGVRSTQTVASSPTTAGIGTPAQADARTHEKPPASHADLPEEIGEDVVETYFGAKQLASGQLSPPDKIHEPPEGMTVVTTIKDVKVPRWKFWAKGKTNTGKNEN